MARAPIPTSHFTLVVVRRGAQFLLVQEQRYGQAWSLPGGRVEPGESYEAAAHREVLEEAGIRVALQGVLRVEHSPNSGHSRVRVIFMAQPIDNTPPKHIPDQESRGAAWLTLDEIRARVLRGSDLLGFLEQVAAGLPVSPLSLVGLELSM